MPITPELRLRMQADRYSLRLQRIQDAIRVTMLTNRLGVALLKEIDDSFETRGASRGRAWKPLRPNTVASKTEAGYMNPTAPLIATGELRSSFRYEVLGGGSVRVYTDVPYAKYHQYGTDGPYFIFPKGPYPLSFITTEGRVYATHVIHPGLPARPFMPTRQKMGIIARGVIEQALREANAGDPAAQFVGASDRFGTSGDAHGILRNSSGRRLINNPRLRAAKKPGNTPSIFGEQRTKRGNALLVNPRLRGPLTAPKPRKKKGA